MATKKNTDDGHQSEQPQVQSLQQPEQFMQAQAEHGQQPVQYIVMQQSLKGVSGWLIFFLICFGIAAIGYIWLFFASMIALSSAPAIVALIFSPLLAGGYIASIVLISMQKKLGQLLTWITLGVSAVYSVISNIVSYVTISNITSNLSDYYSYGRAATVVEKSLPLLIAGIIVSLLIHSLIALYFVLSKRVKETLVE